jgi:hypothetical protein
VLTLGVHLAAKEEFKEFIELATSVLLANMVPISVPSARRNFAFTSVIYYLY